MLLLAVQAVTAAPASAAPSLELNPVSGPAGSQVEVEGSDFVPPPGTPVRLCWNTPGCASLGAQPVEPDGSFSYTITIPGGALPGLYLVYACQGEQCVTAAFVVVGTPTSTTTTVPDTTTTVIPPTTTIPPVTTTVPTSPTTTTTPTTASPPPASPGTTQPGPGPAPPGADGTAPSTGTDQAAPPDEQEPSSAPTDGEEVETTLDADDEEEETGSETPGLPSTWLQGPPIAPQPADPANSGPEAEVLSHELTQAASAPLIPEPGWTLRSPLVLVAVWMASMVAAGLVLITGMWLARHRRQSPTA